MIQLPVGNVSLPAVRSLRHVNNATLVRSTSERTAVPLASIQQCTRRSVLTASTVILQTAWAQQAFAAPSSTESQSESTAEASQQAGRDANMESGNFFVDWPYARPQDVLPFLYATATPGDPASVLSAIEEFSTHYPMYIVGRDKATLLREVVRAAAPRLVVEVGSFIGYSAVTIASTLPAGGRMVCVDACPDCVETARAVVKLAGLSDKVSFELGLSNVIVPGLAARYGTADVVFEDHCKECYARDLVAMEKAGLVVNGTWLVADNVLYPGAPDLLAALRDRERYAAALVPYKYEYDQAWNPNWDPKADAMSVAISLGQPQDLEAAATKIKALCETMGKGRVM